MDQKEQSRSRSRSQKQQLPLREALNNKGTTINGTKLSLNVYHDALRHAERLENVLVQWESMNVTEKTGQEPPLLFTIVSMIINAINSTKEFFTLYSDDPTLVNVSIIK